MKISIIGTGYIGLVTRVCLADFGNNIICVDNDNVMLPIKRTYVLLFLLV